MSQPCTLGWEKSCSMGANVGLQRRWSERAHRTKTTHTLRTGYLSRDSFAFVDRLICAMRQTPAEEILERSIIRLARQAVTACERKYEDFFTLNTTPSAGSTAVTENLQRSILDCQEQLAQQEKTARRAGEKLAILRAAIGESHRPLRRSDGLDRHVREREGKGEPSIPPNLAKVWTPSAISSRKAINV